MSEVVEVTQADRYAALKLLEHAFRNEDLQGVSAECFDDIAEAFARHRLSSPPREALEALEALVAADLYYDGNNIVIECTDHPDAIRRVYRARAALATAKMPPLREGE